MRIFLNNRFILALIFINALLIFIDGFNLGSEPLKQTVRFVDHFITGLFLLEMIVKIKSWGWKVYISSNWDRLDFTLILLSVPSLIVYMFQIDGLHLEFLLVLRVLRIFKSFRFIKFVPGINDLLEGIQRALKTSFVVLAGFFVYLFIVSVLSYYLFKEVSPHTFSDPLTSFYSTFKVFTMEGWYEIPERIATRLSFELGFLTKLYFIFILISGGIFGLSLVNSIFVDAMVSDNNDELEAKVDELNDQMAVLIKKLEARDA